MAKQRTVLELTRNGQVVFRREELLGNGIRWTIGMPEVLNCDNWFKLPSDTLIAPTLTAKMSERLRSKLREERLGDIPLPFCPVCLGHVTFIEELRMGQVVRPEWLREFEAKKLLGFLVDALSPRDTSYREFNLGIQKVFAEKEKEEATREYFTNQHAEAL